MFDSVGKNLDEEATKRGAISTLIVVLAGGATLLGVVAITAYTVKEVVLDQPVDEEIVEIEIEDAVEDMAAPPPPPPPPPAAASDPEEEEEKETPDEMVEEVKKLDEKIEKEMKSDVKPAGQAGGVEGGVEGGVIGGVAGGVVGGVVGGQLGAGGPKTVHYTELGDPKVRVQPDYPSAARGMGIGEQICKVKVEIDENGVPTKIGFPETAEKPNCPKVFWPETERALYKWRWYPYKDNGVKVAAQTTIIVKYRETN